jgi:hypothetical protein
VTIVTATIVNHRPEVSGPIQFYVSSAFSGAVEFGKNIDKGFRIDQFDYRWTLSDIWARVQGRAVPAGGKLIFSFKVYVGPGIDVSIGDGEDGYTTDVLYTKVDYSC